MATKKNISDYNYYDRGYSTGSQTSIFVGPIWVEEALSVNISSTTNDIPVYPYSSEYYNRLLLGRYIVTGTFAIPFIKPNYLLSIIQEASRTQLSQKELKDMISERTTVFTQTVAAKIEAKIADPLKVSKAEISEYARRVSRELEVVSKGFDLTIVQGNLYGETSSIEIYQNVKITQVQKGLLNDDETVVELYSFTAQRMPDRKKPITQETPSATRYILKSDIVAAAKAVVKDIVHEAFTYPEIKVITPTRRPGLIYNTDKMGITGPLNESSRSFGRSISLKEVVYSYKYPLSFNLMNPKTTIPDDESTSLSSAANIPGRKLRYRLPIWRKSTKDATTATIEGYADSIVTDISNAQGNIVSLDRSLSAKYVCAAAQIAPIATSVPTKGGTILVKRTKATNADVGSFVPPSFVANDKFTCADSDLDGLRYGVMWNTLIGCRSSGKSDTAEKGKDDKVIRDIGKPILSVAYYAKTNVSSEDEAKKWSYTISAPVYLDFVDVNLSNMGEGKTEQPLLSDDWKSKQFVLSADVTSKSITVTQPDGTELDAMEEGVWSDDNTMGPVIAAYYDNILLGETFDSITKEGSEAEWSDFVPDNIMRYLSKFHYKFFEITIPLVGKCGIDFAKSLNIQPFVFLRKDLLDDPIFPDSLRHSTDAIPIINSVAQKYTERGNQEDSCKIDFWFDWSVTKVSGDILGQSVTITGLYYAHKKEQTPGADVIADVSFVATILPVIDMTPTEKKAKSPNVITDIKQNGGQYTELYSFVRCDVASYYSVPMYHTATMSALDVLKGSLIQGTAWSYTPVWDHMQTSSEIEYQYGLYKNLMTKFVPNASSVLPDVALNTDAGKTFDLEKDIACLSVIIKNSMSPLAGFVRGYGFSLSPRGIYNALRTIGFSGSDLSTLAIFKKNENLASMTSGDGFSNKAEERSPVCFGSAIDVYNLEKFIVEEIRKIILDEAEIAGYSISSDPLNTLYSTDTNDNTPIYIETQVVTPAEEIVKYGFTSDGYSALTGEATSTSGATSTKTLAGYPIK